MLSALKLIDTLQRSLFEQVPQWLHDGCCCWSKQTHHYSGWSRLGVERVIFVTDESQYVPTFGVRQLQIEKLQLAGFS